MFRQTIIYLLNTASSQQSDGRFLQRFIVEPGILDCAKPNFTIHQNRAGPVTEEAELYRSHHISVTINVFHQPHGRDGSDLLLKTINLNTKRRII